MYFLLHPTGTKVLCNRSGDAGIDLFSQFHSSEFSFPKSLGAFYNLVTVLFLTKWNQTLKRKPSQNTNLSFANSFSVHAFPCYLVLDSHPVQMLQAPKLIILIIPTILKSRLCLNNHDRQWNDKQSQNQMVLQRLWILYLLSWSMLKVTHLISTIIFSDFWRPAKMPNLLLFHILVKWLTVL